MTKHYQATINLGMWHGEDEEDARERIVDYAFVDNEYFLVKLDGGIYPVVLVQEGDCPGGENWCDRE